MTIHAVTLCWIWDFAPLWTRMPRIVGAALAPSPLHGGSTSPSLLVTPCLVSTRLGRDASPIGHIAALQGDETSPIGHITSIAALQGGHRSHCKGCFTIEFLQIQPLYFVNTNLTQVNIEGEGIDGPKWTCYPHTLPDPRAEGSIRNTPEIARRPLGGLSSPRTCSPSTSLDGKLS